MSRETISRERLEYAMGLESQRTIESLPAAQRPYILWAVRVAAVLGVLLIWGWAALGPFVGDLPLGAVQGIFIVWISGNLLGQALTFGAFGSSEVTRRAGRSIVLVTTIMFCISLPLLLGLLGASFSQNIEGWEPIRAAIAGGIVGALITAIYALYVTRRYRRSDAEISDRG